jgi:hypothetical protein
MVVQLCFLPLAVLVLQLHCSLLMVVHQVTAIAVVQVSTASWLELGAVVAVQALQQMVETTPHLHQDFTVVLARRLTFTVSVVVAAVRHQLLVVVVPVELTLVTAVHKAAQELTQLQTEVAVAAVTAALVEVVMLRLIITGTHKWLTTATFAPTL